MMTAPTCPACGAGASGNFCSSCGASLTPRACASCRAELSPQARFCHRCGRPAAGGAVAAQPIARTGSPGCGRRPLRAAGGWDRLQGVELGTPAGGARYGQHRSDRWRPGDRSGGHGPGARHQHDDARGSGSTGSSTGSCRPPSGAIPPRSSASPRWRWALTSSSTAVDADARYHAAVLHLQVGDFAPALALADTILTESPGHLFGYLIRGTAARLQNNPAAQARAEREFLSPLCCRRWRRSGSSIWSTSRRWMSSRQRRRRRRRRRRR